MVLVAGQDYPNTYRQLIDNSIVLTDRWSGYSDLSKPRYKHKAMVLTSSDDPAHVSMPGVCWNVGFLGQIGRLFLLTCSPTWKNLRSGLTGALLIAVALCSGDFLNKQCLRSPLLKMMSNLVTTGKVAQNKYRWS